MGLSARGARLVEALLRSPGWLTVADLADDLGVSERTVHRDLGPAAEYLDSAGLALLKRAGRGIRVEGTGRGRALEGLPVSGSAAPTAGERRSYLLRALLEAKEQVKLRALASRLKVSVGTVSRDLDAAEVWLEGFGLSLVRRRGYGVEVRGSEVDLRRAMSRLILQDIDEAALLARPQGRDSRQVSVRLMGLVDAERLRKVEGLTADAVGRLPYAIADSAFVDLSVHVALMVERLLRGARVEMGAGVVGRLRETAEFEAAGALARDIEREFGLYVPEDEVAYAAMHLRGAKLRQDEDLERLSGVPDLEVASRVSALIHHVEDQTGVTLTGDSLLYTGLLAHLERAVYRLREDMRIYNPLLSEIREDYPALFDLVKEGMRTVFADEEMPDEEIGFVAMHFGAALDRGQGSFPNRVLAVCDAGISSSRMLASRLQRSFPQIRRITNASPLDLHRLDLRDFDLVVSTVPLPLPEGDYVRARPLLSGEEVEVIREHLRERRLHARLADRAASESLEALGGGQTKFHQMAEATQTIAELMEDAFLEEHEAGGSVAEAVRRMSASLAGRGLVSGADRLRTAILRRMERGGVGVPGTALALFHARDAVVVRPSFSVHGFDEPLEIAGMDGAAMKVRRGMLVVAPPELSPVALEAISEISVATIERPAEREAFEDGSEARIIAALQSIFARYLQNKLA